MGVYLHGQNFCFSALFMKCSMQRFNDANTVEMQAECDLKESHATMPRSLRAGGVVDELRQQDMFLDAVEVMLLLRKELSKQDTTVTSDALPPLQNQGGNDSDSMALVEVATERRAVHYFALLVSRSNAEDKSSGGDYDVLFVADATSIYNKHGQKVWPAARRTRGHAAGGEGDDDDHDSGGGGSGRRGDDDYDDPGGGDGEDDDIDAWDYDDDLFELVEEHMEEVRLSKLKSGTAQHRPSPDGVEERLHGLNAGLKCKPRQ